MKKSITAEELDRKFDSGRESVLNYFELESEGITTDQLRELAPLLNMTELARRAGIRKTTLASKIKRGTSLTNEESLLVHRALRDAGLILYAEIE